MNDLITNTDTCHGAPGWGYSNILFRKLISEKGTKFRSVMVITRIGSASIFWITPRYRNKGNSRTVARYHKFDFV